MIEAVEKQLKEGAIIAYPTEAVYGLGCDPFNQQAVLRLLELKCRKQSLGLILLIARWEQLYSLIKPIDDVRLAWLQETWPGPVTWVFPKSDAIPDWISGDHASVAIRMTKHSIARELAEKGPIVSTSANISGQSPALSRDELLGQFPSGIDYIVDGSLGEHNKPSVIYDIITRDQLRF